MHEHVVRRGDGDVHGLALQFRRQLAGGDQVRIEHERMSRARRGIPWKDEDVEDRHQRLPEHIVRIFLLPARRTAARQTSVTANFIGFQVAILRLTSNN